MTKKRIWAAVALVVMACFATMVFADLAHAQQGATDSKSAKGSDKKVATRTGVSGALADPTKKDDEAEGPTKVQMAIGFGSIFVMIAVMKWL